MTTNQIIQKYSVDLEYLINILHEIQDNNEDNSIHPSDIEEVARHFKLNKSQIKGVVEYYSMFSSKPRAKNIISVCKSPVCYLKNSINIKEFLEETLKIKSGESTADKKFFLTEVECLGRCDEAPVISINKEFYGDLDQDKILEILKKY